MTDPISDMFSRIRNASRVNRKEVTLPYSKIKEEVARILAINGFLQAVKVDQADRRKNLIIEIAAADQPVQITEIKRVSRPGRRVYVQSKEIPTIKRGRGMVILSTSQGIMTGAQAASQKLGGELICEVY